MSDSISIGCAVVVVSAVVVKLKLVKCSRSGIRSSAVVVNSQCSIINSGINDGIGSLSGRRSHIGNIISRVNSSSITEHVAFSHGVVATAGRTGVIDSKRVEIATVDAEVSKRKPTTGPQLQALVTILLLMLLR